MLERSAPHYSGLRQEFLAQSRNICIHSLPPEAWHPWNKVLLFSESFSEEEKLNFIDAYLFQLLEAKNIAPVNRNMLPRIRADLNKYRGWLLNRVLRQMMPVPAKGAAPETVYRLPEDLANIVDDLYLFHKHIAGQAAQIARYTTLDDLDRVVRSYRPKYPLKIDERIAAHAKFLQTETPEMLEHLLPPGWKASGDEVVSDMGEKIFRRGGAQLIAVLESGIEVIQISNEDASRAYGSPRWCTAYRNRETYFESYKSNLFVILYPDGRRFQVHIATGQWRDAEDRQINLDTLFQENPLLCRSFTPQVEAIVQRVLLERDHNHFQQLLNILLNDELCAAKAIEAFYPTLYVLAERGECDNLCERLLASHPYEAIRKEIAKHIHPVLMKLEESSYQGLGNKLMTIIKSTPEWYEALKNRPKVRSPRPDIVRYTA